MRMTVVGRQSPVLAAYKSTSAFCKVEFPGDPFETFALQAGDRQLAEAGQTVEKAVRGDSWPSQSLSLLRV
jgi:hypothetical protein